MATDAPGQLDHDDLVQAAREIGLSEEDITAAAEEVRSRGEERAEVAAIRQGAQRKWMRHASIFGAFAVLSLVLAMMAKAPGLLVAATFWAFGVAVHGVSVLFLDAEKERARRAKKRRQKAQLESALRDAKRVSDAVTSGAKELATVLAERIEEEVKRSQHSRGTRSRVAPGGRTRVHVDDDSSVADASDENSAKRMTRR
jgi:hypothetical protein